MIKKLRRRFILIAMISTAIVLIAIIGIINIINYRSVVRQANGQLEMLTSYSESELKSRFSNSDFFSIMNHEPKKNGTDFGGQSRMQEFRFFAVTVDTDGNILEVYTNFTGVVSNDSAKEMATAIYNKGKTTGFYDGFRIGTVEGDTGNTTYIFLDCGRELNTCLDFLMASIGISIAGLILVFILICVFSKVVLKPVEESYAKQKRFITDASHEIKTPLTIIDANTEVMELEHGEDEWSRSIHHQIERLTELTNKLVFLARMDEENYSFTKLDFSLSDAVTETVEPFMSVAAAKELTLEMNVENGISYTGDEAQIRQAVSLLVDNAIKYSKANGRILVSLCQDRKGSLITVWNETDEITAGYHEELFERFYRNDSSRNSKTGGHGVGLSVAQAIVQAHKGKISAKSEDGKSICFTIQLN